MGVISKLKSLLGVGEDEPSRGGDVDVTVEREPNEVAAESERAVKGPGAEASDDGAGATGDGAAAAGAGAGPAGTDAAAGADPTGESAGEESTEDSTAGDSAAGKSATEESAVSAEGTADDGTGAADDGTGDDAGDAAAEPEATDGAAAKSVDDLKGIGPSYASRLSDAGVETVGDMAGRDAAALAEETGLSEKRISRWMEQAEARTR